MDWYEAEVRELVERCQAASPADNSVIVFYGSSSIRLWGTLAQDFPDLPVRNLGFGGSTLEACAHFFPRVVAPCRPRSIVFYAGENDLGDGQPPARVVESFRALRRQIEAMPSAPPLALLSIKPSPARQHLYDTIVATNAALYDEVIRWPGASFIDVHTPMLRADGRPDPALFADDQLHLSSAGYRLWTKLLNAHRVAFVR